MGIPMNFRERLALAIYSHDFEAAAAELRLLECTNPKWAVAAQRARAMVSPPAPLPPRPAFALPVPGAAPGAHLGDDVRERVRLSDPIYVPGDRRTEQ